MASAGDVVTLLGIAFKATQYFRGVHRAPKERDALLHQINSLLSMFEDLKNLTAFMTMGSSKQDRARLRSLIDRLDPELQDLRKHLRQKPKCFDEFYTRFRWPTTKTDVQEKLAELESAVRNIKRCQDIARAKREAWNGLRRWIRPEIAGKLRNTPYIDRIASGTGEALLRSKEFADWRTTNNGVLWCNGPQGSGKTAQIKVIQRHLEDQMDTSGHQVAVVYCNEQDLRSLNDPMDVVMSFWAQLDATSGTTELRLKDETLEELLSVNPIDGLSMLSKEKAAKLKMDIICHHIENSGPTILVLDGLDEVPINSLSSLQQDIVERLIEIQRRTENCHLLFASRPYNSIRRVFYPHSRPSQTGTVFNFQVKVGELDLERYVQEQIVKFDWLHKDSVKGDDPVRRVTDTLVPKCCGEESFLLARLYMHEILRASSLCHLDSILSSLPKSALEAYGKGLARLSKEGAESPNKLPCRAIQALYWVAWAKRPLRSEELEQILAIDEGNNDINFNSAGSMSLKPSLEEFCGELVVVDSLSAEVSMKHKTLTEYLRRPDAIEKWWNDRSLTEYMASILMKYLSLTCMKEPLGAGSNHFDTNHPMLDYALQYWGDYLTNLNENATIWEQVFLFLTGPSQEWSKQIKEKAVAVAAKKHPKQAGEGNDAFSTGNMGPLHWAVHFDIMALVQRLFEHENQFPTENPVPISPLGLAVSHRTEMTTRLLQCGANVNDFEPTNRLRRPPLCDAVAYGCPDAVKILLEAGAQWTLKREINDNSVLHGLYYQLDRSSVANLAVDTMSVDELATSEGLQLLVKGKFTARLQTAIEDGLNINRPCDNGKRALDYAYELADADIIALLKRHGATPRLQWPAFKSKSSSIPQNLPEVQPTGPVIIKEATEFPEERPSQPDILWQSVWEQVLLDVLIDADFRLPVRSLVFETVSCDQGWSSHEDKGTYLGSGHGCSFFVRIRNQQGLSTFDLQNNVHASDTWRLHTNVWNLSDLDTSFPARAQCMRAMQSGTSLQVVSRTKAGGWVNNVRFARVRVYGEEVNL